MQPKPFLPPTSSRGFLKDAPSSVIQPLQKVQNFAARLILMAPQHHHSTPLLKKLHWFPISERIKYKVAYMCFHAINGSGPAYLSELLHIYTLSHTLCSSSDSCMLRIPQYKARHVFALSLTLDPTCVQAYFNPQISHWRCNQNSCYLLHPLAAWLL